ncbi:ricin-like [Malania oleifera]|uniref:ricin-like n=1 Tax=Malania oleifera TaxID=397392 RepID=UPI0025ADE032|nr:ricin-like [Malania oleifera]
MGAVILALHRTPENERQSTLARSLIVAIQMVSEALRFTYIEQWVCNRIGGGYKIFRPDAAMISLENKWKALSKAVQTSKDGIFPSPVQLQKPDFTPFFLSNLNDNKLAPNLAILLFYCGAGTSDPHHFSQMLFTRSVVGDNDDVDSVCLSWEPTARIAGRNGLCIEVTDG